MINILHSLYTYKKSDGCLVAGEKVWKRKLPQINEGEKQ